MWRGVRPLACAGFKPFISPCTLENCHYVAGLTHFACKVLNTDTLHIKHYRNACKVSVLSSATCNVSVLCSTNVQRPRKSNPCGAHRSSRTCLRRGGGGPGPRGVPCATRAFLEHSCSLAQTVVTTCSLQMGGGGGGDSVLVFILFEPFRPQAMAASDALEDAW